MRCTNLYPQVYAWDNLLAAYRKAARGKRGQAPAAAFEYRLADNLLALQAELAGKFYRPGPYASFVIVHEKRVFNRKERKGRKENDVKTEPEGEKRTLCVLCALCGSILPARERLPSFYIHEPKRRLISAAPFRDRVVHHALCNVIEPLLECLFLPDSYANRVGKGTHRALDRAQQFARRYRYVLPGDVRQFFPAIDHAILRAALAQTIGDADVLWLVDRILESGVGVLVEANNCRGRARLERLRRASADLDKVRHYLRLSAQWGWLTAGQYEHVSQMVAELGRLLGGWLRQSGEAAAAGGAAEA